MAAMSSQTQWAPPPVFKAGPETKALARFHMDCTWTGHINAGVMGPGSPEMTATGKGTCRWIMENKWIACDFEQDQFAGNKKILTWRTHWIAGWDFVAKIYRAMAFDQMGVVTAFTGGIEGNKLTMTSSGELKMGGQPAKLRFIWDVTNSKAFTWLNEFSINNGPWTLIEEYICKPVK